MKLSKRIKLKRREGAERAEQLRGSVRHLNLGGRRAKALMVVVGGFLGGIVCERVGTKRSIILLNRAGMFF